MGALFSSSLRASIAVICGPVLANMASRPGRALTADQHPVLATNTCGHRHELPSRGVIHGFDTDHPFHDIVIVPHGICLISSKLGLPGPTIRISAGTAQGFNDLVIVVLVFGLTAAVTSPAALQVAGRADWWTPILDIIRADVHDNVLRYGRARHGVIVRHDFLS